MMLTPIELTQLTGRVRSDAQIRALRFMGIEHRVRMDGTPAVLRTHVENVLGGAAPGGKVRKAAQPNWDAL